MNHSIYRGEVYLAKLDMAYGCEQQGIRPILIIQNDVGNTFSPTTIVAPLTKYTNHKKPLPTHVFVKSKEDLYEDSIVLLEQIRTINKNRLIKKLTTLTKNQMSEVDKSICISTGIS